MPMFKFWNPDKALWKTTVKQQAVCKALQPKKVVKVLREKLLHNFPHRKSKPLPPWFPYSTPWILCKFVFRFRNPNKAFWITSVKQQAVCKAFKPLKSSQSVGEKLLYNIPHKKSKPLPIWLPYFKRCWALFMCSISFWIQNMGF